MVDASALLAVLNAERGAERLTPKLLEHSTISTVNLAEVQGKLVQRGMDADDAWEAALSLVRETATFDAAQAKTAGSLISQTASVGLSFGDRACLALAIALQAPVYTADRLWQSLKIGIRIHVIR